jgi:hypothetical protein
MGTAWHRRPSRNRFRLLHAVLGDSAAPLRMLCIILILGGVIGLKLVG